MNALKKIIGLFLLLVGALLLFVSYGTLIQALINFIKASSNKDLWYLIIFAVIVVFLTIPIIYMIRFGLKLLKPKALPEDSIEDIGKI
ncbi:hypothetical protein EYY60_21610 [Flavobacterium zhairuonense]|uniref:phage holin family protein n=1 Tax=Flavobacterium zhairuonense TaxID=2493631 RepID=UPI00104EA3D4|nr:phage holin family protein [Flavobacterium zhairuonense]KAF2507107.1 hypothetical protein EYY60_21610 [Flavobacterium zhairuonense]